jgi:hypothetical protein
MTPDLGGYSRLSGLPARHTRGAAGYRHLGQPERFIDRREVGDVGAFDSFTDEQLAEEAARLARSLDIAGPHLVEDDSKSRHDDAKS